MKKTFCTLVALASAQTLAGREAAAIPEPGALFREHVSVIAPGYRRPQRSQEVFSSVHGYAPKELPPNPRQFLNEVDIADLEHATRAEVTVELWSGHALTTGRRLRVNEGAWIPLPDPALPDERGQGGVAAEYQFFQRATVPVPLADLRSGRNTFRFDVLEGKAPVFRVWGTIFPSSTIRPASRTPRPCWSPPRPEAASATRCRSR